MKKKLLFGLISVFTIIVVGILVWQFWLKGTTTSLIVDSENYSTEPIIKCRECSSWTESSCVTNFQKDCASKNGVVRWTDLHPIGGFSFCCYQKAPDAGKACASGVDCLSGVCDLESVINSSKCSLIKKELTGEKNQYHGEEFYTATYSCGTTNPGVCTEARENSSNPGGVIHSFKMNKETLIETLTSGPIH